MNKEKQMPKNYQRKRNCKASTTITTAFFIQQPQFNQCAGRYTARARQENDTPAIRFFTWHVKKRRSSMGDLSKRNCNIFNYTWKLKRFVSAIGCIPKLLLIGTACNVSFPLCYFSQLWKMRSSLVCMIPLKR